ncbi:MAG: hypothetical protein HGA76_07800 [Candidatus Firestonebacteria bacterium]|nr:hypothetical protein [Candidatus Firestonebacteria bacterium]
MSLKRVLKVCVLIGWGFLIPACYFTSINPLPKSPAVDPGLLGCWKVQCDEKTPSPEQNYFLFLEDKDGFFQAVLLNDHYQYDEFYRGFCSEINGQKYLNVKQLSWGNEKSGPAMDKNYSLVHYKITEGKRLEITLLDEDKLKEALAKKRLQGSLPKPSDDLVLSDSTENLAAFFGKQDPVGLLGKPLAPAEKTTELPAAGSR